MNLQKLILLLCLSLFVHFDAFGSSILLKIQNCHSESSFWGFNNEIEVFKEGKFFKTLSTKKRGSNLNNIKFLNRIEHELSSLKAGTYTFYFTSKNKLMECQSIDIEDEGKQELTICLDYLNYDAVSYVPFLDKLEEGDSYTVEMESRGCFNGEHGYFSISKTNGRYLYGFPFHGTQVTKVLNDEEIRALRKFEINLKYFVEPGYCTTSTSYTIMFKKEKFSVKDGNCGPNYFQKFLQSLQWKII